MKNTNHYILTIKDSINKFMEIGQIYCDMNTTKQAEKYFLRHSWVKQYLGNKRYQITFKQNSHLIKDTEQINNNF